MKYPGNFLTGDPQYSEMHIHVLFVFQPCPEVLAQNWSSIVAVVKDLIGKYHNVFLSACSVIHFSRHLITLIKGTCLLIPIYF